MSEHQNLRKDLAIAGLACATDEARLLTDVDTWLNKSEVRICLMQFQDFLPQLATHLDTQWLRTLLHQWHKTRKQLSQHTECDEERTRLINAMQTIMTETRNFSIDVLLANAPEDIKIRATQLHDALLKAAGEVVYYN